MCDVGSKSAYFQCTEMAYLHVICNGCGAVREGMCALARGMARGMARGVTRGMGCRRGVGRQAQWQLPNKA